MTLSLLGVFLSIIYYIHRKESLFHILSLFLFFLVCSLQISFSTIWILRKANHSNEIVNVANKMIWWTNLLSSGVKTWLLLLLAFTSSFPIVLGQNYTQNLHKSNRQMVSSTSTQSSGEGDHNFSAVSSPNLQWTDFLSVLRSWFTAGSHIGLCVCECLHVYVYIYVCACVGCTCTQSLTYVAGTCDNVWSLGEVCQGTPRCVIYIQFSVVLIHEEYNAQGNNP